MNQNEGKIDSRTVAIIGGGFSGSMLAVELLRRSAGSLSVVLIERGPVPGRGVMGDGSAQLSRTIRSLVRGRLAT